jgi:hypothetical protein
MSKKPWIKPELKEIIHNDVHSETFVSMLDPFFRSDYVSPEIKRRRKSKDDYLKEREARMKILCERRFSD